MKFSESYIKNVRECESALIKYINIDTENAIHLSLLTDERNCKAALYHNSHLLEFYPTVRKMYIYLDWVNNYLNPETMAEDYGVSSEMMCVLINEGKAVLNKLN
ncbi:hypothetical protein NVP1084O_226 [Vibrio phage 1.084.O._10N.261.49.F5]|nr:hypothetical protein NVP1084O_226 [Vibrio phage 1.084.O._10N.261.49.F5]